MKKSKVPKLFLQIFGLTYLIIFVIMLNNDGIENWKTFIWIIELTLIVDFIIYLPIWAFRFVKSVAEDAEKERNAHDAMIKIAKEGMPLITDKDVGVKTTCNVIDMAKIPDEGITISAANGNVKMEIKPTAGKCYMCLHREVCKLKEGKDEITFSCTYFE